MPRKTFSSDFRRFFLRGLNALAPTLITLAIIYYVLNFLWRSMGYYLIEAIKGAWLFASRQGWVEPVNAFYVGRYWNDAWFTPVLGVVLALLLIYIVGLLVGNLIGQGLYRLGERLVLRVPIVKQIYPSVKQVTELFLADPKEQGGQFAGSRVVAVQYRGMDVWSVGLVTGQGIGGVAAGDDGEASVTVFIPSSPTAFSGYVVVTPKSRVVELPISVDEAMRMLVSGGVVAPKAGDKLAAGPGRGGPPAGPYSGRPTSPEPAAGAGPAGPGEPGSPGPTEYANAHPRHRPPQ